MATAQLSHVLQRLRHIHQLREDDLNDGELLERFFRHRDQTAFEVLVWRYGPMVLGVCQRILRNAHDTEDAFQAVFLVLVNKGSGLFGRQTIGNWLHGVAYHTALKARATAVQRQSKESQVPVKPCVEPVEEDAWQELRPLLDHELNKLPDKFRAAVLLCDVLGKSRKEAAQQLGIAEGTLSSRLATARRKLAERLKHHGVKLSAGALAVCLARKAAACVPPQLVSSTAAAAGAVATGAAVTGGIVSPSVAALVQGVLNTMFVTKCKTAVVLLLGLVLLTGGAAGWSAVAAPQQDNQPKAGTAPAPDQPGDKEEGKKEQPKKDEPKKESKKDEVKNGDPDKVPFSKIHLKSGKVIVTQTGKQAVEVKGDELLTQNAKSTVEDGVLQLEGHFAEFHVQVKDLTALTIEGLSSADIKDLKTKRLEVTIKTSGKVVVSGTADEQVIDVSGVGSFNGEACKGKQGKVTVNGSGQAAVNVSDKLQANAQGVGRVYYLGSPKVEAEVAFAAKVLEGPAPADGVGGFGGFGGGFDRGFGRFTVANRLGAELTKPIDALVEQLDLPKDQGLVLSGVKADSAAAKAGLKNNDILLELGGKKVANQPNEFLKTLNEFKTGDKVDAVVLRKGKRETVKDVTLPEVPKNAFDRGFPGGFPRLPNVPKIEIPKIPNPNLPDGN